MTASPPSPNLGQSTASNKTLTTATRLSSLVSTLNAQLSPITSYELSTGEYGLTISGNIPGSTAMACTGVWTAPDLNNGENYTLQVEVQGAGGGGGGGGSAAGGGGGGGGEYALEENFTITPGKSYVWVVAPASLGGAATSGTAPVPGVNGTLTIFDAAATSPATTDGVVANGGQGADQSTTGAGGPGGTGSTNTVHYDGARGADDNGDTGSDNPQALLQTTGSSYWTPSAPSASALVFYYIFNDDAGRIQINDASGNGYNATVTRYTGVTLGDGTPTAPQQSCAFGNSQSIFGTTYPANQGTSIQFPLSSLTKAAGKVVAPAVGWGSTTSTISGWIQADPSGTWGNTAAGSVAVITSNSQNYTGNRLKGYSLFLSQNGSASNPDWVLCAAVGNGTSRTECQTALTPTPGQWYYVVMTWDSGTLNLYVDDTLEATATSSGYTSIPGGAFPFTMGLDPGATANWFFGAMSNFWYCSAAAGTGTLGAAYGVTPPAGGAGGGAGSGAGGTGSAGSSGEGSTGGSGGTPASVPAGLTGVMQPGQPGQAGANTGNSNASAEINSPGGGGGGAGGTSGTPPEVFTLTVPVSTAGTYCGADAGSAAGTVYNAPLEGSNTQLFYGGANSDSDSGSKNSMLVLPPGLTETLNPATPGGPSYQICAVSLTLTNAMVRQTVTNICELSYAPDTSLPDNYTAADTLGILGAVPFRATDTTVTYDLTWNADFIQALQGTSGSAATAIVLGPGNTPSFDAYNADTGVSYYGAVYGPGSYDSTGNALGPYLTISYVESSTFPNQGSAGGSGQITLTQVNANAQIAGTNIASATITGSNIAANTIEGSNIASATVTGSNIASDTIEGSNIASATVTGTNIASSTITGTNIESATITGTNIASNTITGTNIESATITGSNIKSATVTGTNIASGTITASNIENATITSAQISGTAGITGSQIANATIAGENIASGTITASNIENATITSTQIAGNAGITGNQIAGGTISASNIANATITNAQISGSAGITGSQIAGGTITNSNIANATITNVQIANGSITGSNISPTAGISGSQLANDTVTSTQIANGTITTTEISPTADITGSQLAAGTISPSNLSSEVTARSIGGITTTVSQLAPSSPNSGDMWINTSAGNQLNQYGGVVPQLMGSGGSTTVSPTAPATFSSTQAFTGPGLILVYYGINNTSAQTVSIADSQSTTYTQEAQITGDSCQGFLYQAAISTGTTIPSGTTWTVSSTSGNVICTVVWVPGATGLTAYSTAGPATAGTFDMTASYAPAATDTSIMFGSSNASPTFTASQSYWNQLYGVNTYPITNAGIWYATGQTASPEFTAALNPTSRYMVGIMVDVSAPAWAPVTFTGSDVLASGSVTAGQIANATITASQLASSVTARSLGGINTTISTSVPSTGVVGDIWIDSANGYQLYQCKTAYTSGGTVSDWTAVTFTGSDVIAAGTITGSLIEAATITGSLIAAGTITASNIESETITASQIASGTITATQIESGTITTTQINASAGITGSQIAAGTVTASNIESATITSEQIASGTIVAGNIESGTLTSTQIAAGSIEASSLTISYDGAIASYAPEVWLLLNDSAGSATAQDYSGNGYTGTATGATFGESLQGIPGNNSVLLSGAGNIATPYNPSSLSAFTAIIWVNLDGLTQSGNPRLVNNAHADSSPYQGFELYLNGGTTPRFVMGTGTATNPTVTSSTALASGWNMVAAVWTGSEMELYLNGTSVGSAAASTYTPVQVTASMGSSAVDWGMIALTFSNPSSSQSTYQFGYTNPSSSTSWTIAPNYGAEEIAAGDSCLVQVATTAVSTLTVSDSAGNSYVPVASVPNLITNSYLTSGSSEGWTAYEGTLTLVLASTLASGLPSGLPYVLEYVNNGTSAGALEGTDNFNISVSTEYTVTAWVYSSTTSLTVGADWHSNTGYVSTSTNTVTVTADTWTAISTTVTSPSSGVTNAIPRIGSSTLSCTIYAVAIQVTPEAAGMYQYLFLAQDCAPLNASSSSTITVSSSAAVTGMSSAFGLSGFGTYADDYSATGDGTTAAVTVTDVEPVIVACSFSAGASGSVPSGYTSLGSNSGNGLNNVLSYTASAQGLTLGEGIPYDGDFVNGYLSDFAFFTTALTATQISAAYDALNGGITAERIASGTITGNLIAGQTITASNIAAETITAAQIAANAVEAGNIAAGTVVAGIVDGTTVSGAEVEATGTEGGFFGYAGTPTAGNMVFSAAPAGGTDSYGNPYPSGMQIGLPGLSQILANPLVNSDVYLSSSISGILEAAFELSTTDGNEAIAGLLGSTLLGKSGSTMATFSAVGSLASTTSNVSISGATLGVGDFVMLTAISETTDSYLTSVSSSNCNWQQVGEVVTGSTNAYTAVTYIGEVFQTGSDTFTFSWSGTPPIAYIACQEFSTSSGEFPSFDTQAMLDSSGTNTWPDPTATGSGEFYWGYAYDSGSSGATKGTTSGYTFELDSADNGVAYGLDYSGTAPVWGDSDQTFGMCVLMSPPATGNTMSTVLTSPLGSGSGSCVVLMAEADDSSTPAGMLYGVITTPDDSTLIFQPVMYLTAYACVLYSSAATLVTVTKTSGSGTITIPSGVTTVKAEAWGGGGGGGGSSLTSNTHWGEYAGGGGGGGEYACEPTLAVGSSVSYSVGAGGAAGTGDPSLSGSAGSSSTITGSSVTVTANGGSGGQRGITGPTGGDGGAGGTGSTNTVHYDGGVGGRAGQAGGTWGAGGGSSAGTSKTGNGGGTSLNSGHGYGASAPSGGGAGGNGGIGARAHGGNGTGGTAPGGAGGGAAGSDTDASGNYADGGNGAHGQIRITYSSGAPSVGFSVNFGSSAITDPFGNNVPANITTATPIYAIPAGNTNASTQESWHDLTLASGWENNGGAYAPLRYRLLPDGNLQIDGLVKYTGSSTGTITIATLPSGYQPTYNAVFPFTLGNVGSRYPYQINAGGIIEGLSIAASGDLVEIHCIIPLN